MPPDVRWWLCHAVGVPFTFSGYAPGAAFGPIKCGGRSPDQGHSTLHACMYIQVSRPCMPSQRSSAPASLLSLGCARYQPDPNQSFSGNVENGLDHACIHRRDPCRRINARRDPRVQVQSLCSEAHEAVQNEVADTRCARCLVFSLAAVPTLEQLRPGPAFDEAQISHGECKFYNVSSVAVAGLSLLWLIPLSGSV